MKDKISVKDYVDLHAHYLEKIDEIHEKNHERELISLQTRYQEALKMLFDRVERVAARVNTSEGEDEGTTKWWGYAIAGVTVLISIVAAWLEFHKYF